MENYKYLLKFFQPNIRKDIDECCEIAHRYNLVIDEEKGLLKGKGKIYEESYLNELRVARLFERFFGKGCLSWDPPGSEGDIGEFILSVDNVNGIKCDIFVEVKTREKQGKTEYGLLESNEDKIIGELQKAYKKVKDGLEMPFLTVLCHDHYDVHIDSFQIIKSCFGLIYFQDESPKVFKHGYLSPCKHRNLSAIGLYYFYVNTENKKPQEFFEVFHNHYAKIQIDKRVFGNKADKQFYLTEWNGKFTDI